jgi:hypothetical protein
LSSEWTIALGTQWIVILFFSRFLLSYANGPDALLADLRLFGRGYIAELFTTEFLITLMIAVAIWQLTAQFLELLDEIGLDMKWALSENPVHNEREAVPAHQRMVNLILTMGIVLVIMTVLTRLNMRTILSNTGGLPPVEVSRFSGAEAGALLYFIFGLGLLSLSRLMSLQTHWNQLRIPVSSKNLPRQWAIYSLFFLLGLAMLVSLLPAGDSLGFFSVLGTLFGFLITIFVFISQLILGLILLLFSLPLLLLGTPPPFLANRTPPPIPVFPTQPLTPAINSELLALLKSIILWGGLVLILVFSIIHFVRQHAAILPALRKWRVTNWLLLAWQWLYKNVDKARSSVLSAIQEGWQNIFSRLEEKRLLPRPGWINVRSLDPRRQVYFFYLAMVRRGGEQGIAREPSQTPSEYALELEKAVPDAMQDIDSITDAFIEARYSHHEVDSDKVNLVKATWERVRRALRVKSRNGQSRNP